MRGRGQSACGGPARGASGSDASTERAHKGAQPPIPPSRARSLLSRLPAREHVCMLEGAVAPAMARWRAGGQAARGRRLTRAGGAQVCIVGPAGSAKTVLTNNLADLPVPTGYEPTVGCRVQEIERPSGAGGRSGMARVRLWDCAGGSEYQGCWPALAHGCEGLLMVYDPDVQGSEETLEALYRVFAQPRSLREKQCCVLAVVSSEQARSSAGLQGKLSQLRHIVVDAAQLAQGVRCDAALSAIDAVVAAAAQ